MHEQDGIVHHEAEQGDEADHRQQIHRQIHQSQQGDAADGGERYGRYHQQAVNEGTKQAAHQQVQDDNREDEAA